MKPTQQLDCTFPDCGRKQHGKGFCSQHLRQQIRGQQLRPLVRQMHGASIQEKLAAYSEDKGGCRLWIGTLHEKGYGQLRWDGRTRRAHRVAYTLEHGPIPDGMQVNHICGNRACIKVSHLELVTSRQNSEYRTSQSKYNTSGYRGVSYYKAFGRYQAKVTSRGVSYFVGYFDTAEDADAAAREARARLHSMPEFDERVITAEKGAM